MRRAPQGRPTWRAPERYGYAEAVQAAGGIVAPLLAGFSITLIVLVIDRGDVIRCPDLALVLLVGAATSLLAAIQCAYSARQYVVRPDELEAWWPEIDDEKSPYAAEERDAVRAEQFGHARLHALWARRFRAAYHAGVLLVLSALVAILVPSGEIPPLRWAAISLACAAVAAETAWVLATIVSGWWKPADPAPQSEVGGAEPRPWHRRLVEWLVPPYRLIEPPDVQERRDPGETDSNE